LTVTGSATVEFADGSASTPSITNDGDTNTGIFFPAADTVAISAGGTNKAQFGTGSATIDGLTVGRGAGAVATNTAVGASALAAVTTGGSLVAVGSDAGKALTTGADSVAVGANALQFATTGTSNVGLGQAALYQTTTGGFNSALGTGALQNNTIASYNTAVGYQAGYTANRTADANGYNALFGYQAGYAITTGNSNCIIGSGAGALLTTGIQNTFVGANTGVGSCGGSMTTGSRNTIIGGYNGNQGGLDIRTASNHIVLSDGDGNPRQIIDNNGYFKCLGMWNLTGASAANLYSDNTGQIYRSTSALKYKKDIRDLENIDINLLRPVRYKSKCEMDDQTIDHFGIVADEAADAGFEELVTRGIDNEVEGFQYERLTVVLLKKLQTLDAEFKAYVATHP
jgi:hypothetical protein